MNHNKNQSPKTLFRILPQGSFFLKGVAGGNSPFHWDSRNSRGNKLHHQNSPRSVGDIWGYSFWHTTWVISSVVFFSQVRQAFCPTHLTTKVINSTQWTSSPSFPGENQHKTNNIPQKIYYLDFHFSFVISLGWWFVSIFYVQTSL